jgi:excisionase family DNA binding protein
MKVEAIVVTPDTTDDFLTTASVARMAGRTPDTVRHWERSGVLHAIRLAGGQRLFRRDVVERFLQSRRGEAA